MLIKCADFDIEQIARSGQCFRIFNKKDEWHIIAFDRCLRIQQYKDTIYFDCSEEEFQNIWYDYFDFSTDYGYIKQMIRDSHDDFLIRAMEYGSGIRILRQNPWETVVSFIISQRNSITRITNTIKKLCAPFGYHFPTANDLKSYSIEDFYKLGLGYRAPFLYEIVQKGIDNKFGYARSLNYLDLIVYLKKFKGIGDKVANCIALFGFHKTEAFPIDVWMQKIIDTKYGGNFDKSKFSPYEGIIQQYMFFYGRESGRL